MARQTTIGSFIRERRRELEMTQEDLEERTGITQSYLSQIERGVVARPLRDKLDSIASALRVPVWQLAALAYGLRVDEIETVEDSVSVSILGSIPSGDALSVDPGGTTVRVLPEIVANARGPFAVIVESGGEFLPAGIVAGDAVILDCPDGRTPRHRQIIAARICGTLRLVRWLATESGVAQVEDAAGLVHSTDDRDPIEIIGLYIAHQPTIESLADR